MRLNQSESKPSKLRLWLVAFITIIAICPIAVVVYSSLRSEGDSSQQEVSRMIWDYEIADTRQARIQGLSNRESLPESSGLLFVFEGDGSHGIWMKDMRFSLDIIWMDEAGRVVYIEEDVSPDTFPKTFVSPTSARYVLEVNAGQASFNNLAIGDTLTLP